MDIIKRTAAIVFTAFLLFPGHACLAQKKITVEEYILTYKDEAMQKMKEYAIPASITLAQGILESGSGNSELARKANNHFGIKCHKGWTGRTFYMDDDHKNECFRKYKSPGESFRDHSLFLTQRERYAGLFRLDIYDYQAWAHGLSSAGYATNPRYPQLLIKIIEENRLYEFDRGITPEYLAAAKGKGKESSGSREQALKQLPLPSQFELVEIWETGRKVYVNNGVKFIFARAGDTFSAIAADFEIYSWQLPRYNELDKDAAPAEGQIIYISRKKRKNREALPHTVRSGESMHAISQLYGVRLKRLYKMNGLETGAEVAAGRVLKLK